VQETRSSVVPSSLMRRSAVDRLVTGTAGGLGERLRVDPIVVRLGFVLLTLAGGLGLLLYGLGFVVSSEPEPDGAAPDAPRRIRTVATASIIAGVLLVLRDLGVWFGDPIVVPATIAVMGSSVISGRSDAHSGRGRWPGRRWMASATRVVRTIIGFGMVGLGTVWLVAAAGPYAISFGSIVVAWPRWRRSLSGWDRSSSARCVKRLVSGGSASDRKSAPSSPRTCMTPSCRRSR
jgi:phage shock protein PspC (stress-responsive transcriptional regulator)